MRLFSLRSPASGIAAAALALAVATAAARAAQPPLPRTFPAAGELVAPRVVVRAAPSLTARRVGVLTEFRRDYRPRIVLALELRADVKKQSRLWYRISLAGRPNGRTGWIPTGAASLRPTRAEIVIHRGTRRLELLVDGKGRLRTRVAVGRPGMETPLGLFYVTARFKPRERFLGAFALETSAYSKLSEWPGGGVVGIHGTDEPRLLGQAVSHGCVRVSNEAALVLKRLAPLGTPIRILH